MIYRIRLDEFDAMVLLGLAGARARELWSEVSALSAADSSAPDLCALRVRAEYFRRLVERLAADLDRQMHLDGAALRDPPGAVPREALGPSPR